MNRRVLTILLLMISFSTPLLPSVVAQKHALEWGVEVGEEFTYALQRKSLSPALEGNLPSFINFLEVVEEGEKVRANVTYLAPIPEEIGSGGDTPLSYCDLLTEDDDSVLASNISAFLFPVGDWDFLTELLGGSASGVQFIDTADEWGTIQSGQYVSGDATIEYYLEWRYEKENGTLNYLEFRNLVDGNLVADIIFAQWEPGMPTVLPPDSTLSTVLLIALAASIGIIVAIIVYKWYRGRKPLVQQLGE